MSSLCNLVGTGLLSLLALVVFQNSALGEPHKAQEQGQNTERALVLESNSTPQWAPASPRPVTQAPAQTPHIVTVGEGDHDTELAPAKDRQSWIF